MVIGLGQKLDTARIVELMKTIEHFRGILLELIQHHTRQGIGDAEVAFVPPDQIQHQPIGRQVAFVGHLQRFP